MGFLASTVLALSVALAPAAPPASAPKAELPIFTPFRVYQNFAVGIDKNSVKLFTSGPYPLVGLDIQLTFPVPLRFADAPFLVKSYTNSVAIDCFKDQIIVIVSRAFDEKGELRSTLAPAGIIPNPHTNETPTTELINLLCPPILERYKPEEEKKPVTKPGALTA